MITLEAALARATALKTKLALSKVRLAQSFGTITPATTKAQLVAAEATYDGYTAGGKVVTAFGNPYLSNGGGYAINSGVVQFDSDPADPNVTNTIDAWWIETAAGDIYDAGNFPGGIPMGAVGQAIPLTIEEIEGRNG